MVKASLSEGTPFRDPAVRPRDCFRCMPGRSVAVICDHRPMRSDFGGDAPTAAPQESAPGRKTWSGIVLQSFHERPIVIELAPGESATFGRGTPDRPVDIILPDAGVSRLAGTITAVEDHWLISNLSHPSFLVFAPQHLYAEHQERPDGSGDATRVAFPLDETAKYFLVLVALCEPRLRDCSSPVVRTVPEMIERLGDLPGARGLTRTAVNFHIDYLARTKLRVKAPDGAQDGPAKADWQRAALISLALQFDLVREEHLALLPPV